MLNMYLRLIRKYEEDRLAKENLTYNEYKAWKKAGKTVVYKADRDVMTFVW